VFFFPPRHTLPCCPALPSFPFSFSLNPWCSPCPGGQFFFFFSLFFSHLHPTSPCESWLFSPLLDPFPIHIVVTSRHPAMAPVKTSTPCLPDAQTALTPSPNYPLLFYLASHVPFWDRSISPLDSAIIVFFRRCSRVTPYCLPFSSRNVHLTFSVRGSGSLLKIEFPSPAFFFSYLSPLRFLLLFIPVLRVTPVPL